MKGKNQTDNLKNTGCILETISEVNGSNEEKRMTTTIWESKGSNCVQMKII